MVEKIAQNLLEKIAQNLLEKIAQNLVKKMQIFDHKKRSEILSPGLIKKSWLDSFLNNPLISRFR